MLAIVFLFVAYVACSVVAGLLWPERFSRGASVPASARGWVERVVWAAAVGGVVGALLAAANGESVLSLAALAAILVGAAQVGEMAVAWRRGAGRVAG